MRIIENPQAPECSWLVGTLYLPVTLPRPCQSLWDISRVVSPTPSFGNQSEADDAGGVPVQHFLLLYYPVQSS